MQKIGELSSIVCACLPRTPNWRQKFDGLTVFTTIAEQQLFILLRLG